MNTLQTPYPWFGGKRYVAKEVWSRLGRGDVYIEPFFGGGAVFMAGPHAPNAIINDADPYVANFWRAVKYAPDEVAAYADWPVLENDLHARHVWLRAQLGWLQTGLGTGTSWHDTKVAGWWVWGQSLWIGGGWCVPETVGPWHVVDGQLVLARGQGGVARKLVDIGTGRGVHRKRVHLTNSGTGVHKASLQELIRIKRAMPRLTGSQDVRRKPRDEAQDDEHSCHKCGTGTCGLGAWMRALSRHLANTAVYCLDFEDVLGMVECKGTILVFLDPPYAHRLRSDGLYGADPTDASSRARRWALAHADDPRYRIALCGYDDEHDMPDNWTGLRWRANGGYGNQRKAGTNTNKHKETVWFSPHCLKTPGLV